ncbi:MAG: T9SS type A sorting domain-containing protein [Bacteroidota bacterium]
MIYRVLFVISLVVYLKPLDAQPDYTANDTVPPYGASFAYGSNMGYYPPWQDEQLADIAKGNPAMDVQGLGVTSLRPALFAHFLEQWGYDIRTDAFQHYKNLGIDITAFIGYPSPEQRDTTRHCPAHQSELFANMYEPIWDDGRDGTPINDDNTYALYLYKMVRKYGPYIRIWEVWNEPDFDYSGNAWKTADMPGSWWKNNPEPCGHALRAPIFHYVRLLRISYEVIKTFDSDALIATGGLGFPSYLDAILRNTDNPEDGSPTAAYPLGGGAYFDVLSFHSYPHIDGSLRRWNNDRQAFDYFRHSDAAAAGVVKGKKAFEKVLHRYNYNGRNHPEKEFIITECNIPRKAFGDYIGSNEAQRNFILKTLIEIQKEKVRQLHVYQLSELNTFQKADNEFQMMGLYEQLQDNPPYSQKPTEQGIAFRTISEQLGGKYFDERKTKEMLLPSGIGGAAFTAIDGTTTYALWAKTPNDQSELATASYAFPAVMNVGALIVRAWDHSRSGDSLIVKGARLQLDGSPVFVEMAPDELASQRIEAAEEALSFRCFPNPFTDSLTILFRLQEEQKVRLRLYDFKGRLLQTYHTGEPLLPGIYQHIFRQDVSAGVYFCQLEMNNQRLTKRVVKVQRKEE